MLQSALWAAVAAPAQASQTPVTALVVAGMNDVINTQGYTQASWWNRIPAGAWGLVLVTAAFCNLLVGYGDHREGRTAHVLPLVLCITLFFIADIDAPRGGVILVAPQNLEATAASMRP